MSAQCPQESQVEEAQQTTDESATVPELEEVLNRSKEEIQMSVSEMEDAIRPEESIIRKIQRYFWGSSESPQCVDIQSMGPAEATSPGGENEALVDMMRKLEWAYQQLYARDAYIWQLRRGANLPQAQSTTKEQGLQHTPNELMKPRYMTKADNMTESSGRDSAQFEASGSISGIDTEAVNSSVEDGLEGSSPRNSELGEWLTVEKEQMRFREQGWSKLHKEGMNHSTAGDVSRQQAEEARLQKEMNKIQESRDKIQEQLEATEAQLGSAQLRLEQKDEEITTLRTSLANARAEFRAGEEGMRSYDDVRSFDEESTKGWERPESIHSNFKQSLKEGKPLSELVKNTGLLGKALSFRHKSSLKQRKIPVYAQETAMRLGSTSDLSGRGSMGSN
ncbi:hypothetical protein AX14_001373 [Amanita brunnescens Koide BX004]|nr:hypothetical protein AX14_001373 [Amanita brunnescens Koide BX004]